LVSDSIVVGGPYFVGNKTMTAIDELCIYKHKLTAQEILEAYQRRR
jgi:hypothetical protein